MMNPVEELLNTFSTKIKLAETKQNEFDLWQKWKDSDHDPNHFRPLLKSFKPILNKTVRQYSRVAVIPTEAIEAEVRTHFLNACKTYKPDSGAQLGTWVNWHLRKTKRYTDEYANIGKIPEPRIGLISKYNLARSELHDQLERPPTHVEIAHHINLNYPLSSGKKLNAKEVKNLDIELSRKDFSESGFEEGPVVFETPKELEAIRMLHSSRKLSTEERHVFNHIFGVHTDPHNSTGETMFHPAHMKKPGEIASITGFSNSKISRLRNSIADKIKDTVDLLD